MKIIENNSLNLMNLFKKILLSTDIVYHLMNKKTFNDLVEERSPEFKDLEKKLILIIWFISTKLKDQVLKF